MSDALGSVIRITSPTVQVHLTIDVDNQATRSFLGMLPLDGLSFRDNGGLERVSELPEPIRHDGVRGSGIRRGDVFYYVPWGSLALWYSRMPFPPRPELIHLGRHDATSAQLAELESGSVRAELLKTADKLPDNTQHPCPAER